MIYYNSNYIKVQGSDVNNIDQPLCLLSKACWHTPVTSLKWKTNGYWSLQNNNMIYYGTLITSTQISDRKIRGLFYVRQWQYCSPGESLVRNMTASQWGLYKLRRFMGGKPSICREYHSPDWKILFSRLPFMFNTLLL